MKRLLIVGSFLVQFSFANAGSSLVGKWCLNTDVSGTEYTITETSDPTAFDVTMVSTGEDGRFVYEGYISRGGPAMDMYLKDLTAPEDGFVSQGVSEITAGTNTMTISYREGLDEVYSRCR